MIRFLRIAACLLLAALPLHAGAELQFGVGEPAEGAVKSGIGQISGWAVSDQEIVSVEALIDGASLGKVPYGGTRLDVAAAFPDYPDSEFSGWSMKWNYALHEEGEHLLTVIFTEKDGTQTRHDVAFSTTRFNTEFISDPNAVRTFGANVYGPADGRIMIEGAEMNGEQVDIELAWDRPSQQFLVVKVHREQLPQANKPPQSSAGPDQTVRTGEAVTLYGSASDADGSVVGWQWSQVSGPAVTLAGAGTEIVSFTAPGSAGTIRLRFTVTDNEGATAADDVLVRVEEAAPPPNRPPVANAGPDQVADTGDLVTLFGSASDPDGSVVAWQWTQVSGPAVALSGANSEIARFTAPGAAATIRLRFTVTDDDGASASDDVFVTVQQPAPPPNQAPTADAGADRTVDAGASVTIYGSSSDPDGSVVAWQWTQLSGPAVSLGGASSEIVSFTAPGSAGTILLRFTVTDDDGASASDEVYITVEEAGGGGGGGGGGLLLESMLDEINAARGQARDCGGTAYPAQPPLSWSAALAGAAAAHSADMASNGFFSHTGTGGTTIGDRLFPVWDGTIVGENIAASSIDRPDAYVVQLWLDSPGHCALIMDGRFSHAGIGYAADPGNGYQYHHFWTLDFGG